MVGDTVVEEWGHGYKNERITTVERMTATQLMVKGANGAERKYRRDDGRKVGGEWSQRIQPPTQQRLEKIRKRELIERIEAAKWAALPLDVLEAVAKVLP